MLMPRTIAVLRACMCVYVFVRAFAIAHSRAHGNPRSVTCVRTCVCVRRWFEYDVCGGVRVRVQLCVVVCCRACGCVLGRVTIWVRLRVGVFPRLPI